MTLLTIFALFNTGCYASRSAPANAIQRSIARQEVKHGERLLVEAENAEAEAVFRRALKFDPRNSSAHAYLAKILAKKGEDERACEHYREALKYTPDNVNYSLGLGDCLSNRAMTSFHRQRLFDAAVKSYRHARSQDPKNFSAALKLGICYRRMGAYDSAIKTLLEAERLNPVSARVHNELADIYKDIRNGDTALVHLRRSLQIDPDQPAVQEKLRNRKKTTPLAQTPAFAHD